MKNFSFRTKKSSPQNSEGKKVIFRILFYIALALCAVFFFRSFIGTFSSDVVGMVLRTREYFTHSSATFPSYVRSRDELHAEIERLNEELAAQSGDRTTISKLAEENEELRALLGDTPNERLLASVIARPPYTPYDALVIDQGSEHGIREGAIVYHKNDHAIGMVDAVFPALAVVTLFSSPGVESTVYLYGPDVYAYAYGEGGGVIRVSLPQGVTVREGDAVVLPSLGSGDLGVVERIVSVSTQPEQSAYLTFPIPIQSLRTVTVAKEPTLIPDIETLEVNVARMREKHFVTVPDTLRLGTATITATSSNDVPRE